MSWVGRSATVVVDSICDQFCILPTEGQDDSIEVLVGQVTRICRIEASENHVDVVIVEV